VRGWFHRPSSTVWPFLAAGDVALTRRALALSARSAVVLKFSRARRRKERQGVLVEEMAIEQAELANTRDETLREDLPCPTRQACFG
jgi:hypothetical protein